MSILSSLYSGVTNSISAVTSAVSNTASRILNSASQAVGRSIGRTTVGMVMDKIKPDVPSTTPQEPIAVNEPSGVVETIQDLLGKAGSAASELVSQTKKRVIKEVAMAAFDTTINEIKGHVTEGVASLGAQLGQSAAEKLESVIVEGTESLDSTLGTIGKKFRSLLAVYKEKIDTNLQKGDLSASEQLGFTLANLLHDKLSDLGDACFQAKKLSVDAFKQQSADAINRAKPAIEKELGAAFVNFLLTPITSFLQGIMTNVMKSLFSFFKESASPSTTPVTPEAVVTLKDGVEVKAEDAVNEDIDVESDTRLSM
ncbi:hypothetical protein Lmor_0308 [Legionella moravica]|uniref:Uncharacterized protein n=1 Tax=Legionella moravica TaxID=39962 RepID=A0A378JZJ4_9GAMM|nr:hypothetical protein [Legionella moravica]KTD38487.1 hypothetical protein Lmor_0308 [Legionella moravica]STX62818.1 Uncharacterised protein [Legionella moravica]